MVILRPSPGAALPFAGDDAGPEAVAGPPDPAAVSAVREALSGRGFPWYDPNADEFRAVMPPRPPSPPNASNPRGWSLFDLGAPSLEDLGRLIVFVLLAAGLTALILYVARTWRRRPPAERRGSAPQPVRVSGSAARSGSLPTGLAFDESDPIEAARALRARGERGRAVVLLFAHQLLTLDRLGMIRLSPGRTGRQLVRSIGDDVVRGAVGRTLRMFESVYYGHREPEEAAFEALWAEAEALDATLAAGWAR